MGPNHPISLKIKKNYGWDTILYKFNLKKNSDIVGLKNNILEVLNHYFQFLLISKPKFYYTNEKINIVIYYYIISNRDFKLNSKNKKINISKNLKLLKINELNKFEIFLSKYFNIQIQIKLKRLKNPILDTRILAEFISINLKNYSINSIWRILLKKIKLKNIIHSNEELADTLKNYNFFNWDNILKNGLFNKEFYSYINGLKLKISGRTSKRRRASRTKTRSLSIGSFKFNSINSLINYGHIERKDKNGSQSIKIFSSTKILFKKSASTLNKMIYKTV
jgi:hypothetical protein